LTVVAGQTTAGKTQLALQFASAVESPAGGEVAGLLCAHGTVVYLDSENGSIVAADRLRSAGLGTEMKYYLDMSGMRLDRETDCALLHETIRQTKASLVIVDSLRRLAGVAKEDSADDMAAFVGDLAATARATRAAIVLLHHRSTKSGAATVRGSSAIEDQSDILYRLDKVESGPSRRLVCTKMRVAREPSPVSLRLQTDPLRLVCTAGDFAENILNELADGETLSFQALGERLGMDTHSGAARKRLHRALGPLIADGTVIQPGHGKYRRDVTLKRGLDVAPQW
jgi:hypothetical protein